MIEPTQNDIGRKVIYTPAGDYPGKRSEEGVISSMNAKYVFVRFGSSAVGVPCYRNDLTWP